MTVTPSKRVSCTMSSLRLKRRFKPGCGRSLRVVVVELIARRRPAVLVEQIHGRPGEEALHTCTLLIRCPAAMTSALAVLPLSPSPASSPLCRSSCSMNVSRTTDRGASTSRRFSNVPQHGVDARRERVDHAKAVDPLTIVKILGQQKLATVVER